MKKIILTLTVLFVLGINFAKAQKEYGDKYEYFNCDYVGGRVILNWVAAFDSEDEAFFIERSDNGINYTIISYVVASKIPFDGRGMRYSFIDKGPLDGYSYYRIRTFGTKLISDVKVVFNNYSIKLDAVSKDSKTVQ